MTTSDVKLAKKPRTALPEDKMASRRVLAVFNVDIAKRKAAMQAQGSDKFPKADFFGLIETLKADAVDLATVEQSFSGRLVKKVLGKNLALAWVAFLKAKDYDVIYSDGEPNGIPLAILLKLTRHKQKVSMIGHLITAPKKVILLRLFGLTKQIGVIFLHSTTQYTAAINKNRIPAANLRLLPYQVDPDFWRPDAVTPPESEKPYICSAGLEFRDYGTLINAIKDLPVDLRIGAASHWSRRSDSALQGELPPNVQVKSYNYTELRELYAGSQFVVVPLHETPFQAGITTILEAMAMGKAVIVTRTSGQVDVVTDRRRATRGPNRRNTEAVFPRLFKAANAGKATGIYVSPYDVTEMRKAIEFLLKQPQKAAEMGRNGRALLEEMMTLDQFCHRIKQTLSEIES